MSKFAKLSISLLIPVIYVAGIAYYIGRQNPAPRVKAEIQRIRLEGAPTSVRDVVGKAIPDSQNAAIEYEYAIQLISSKQAKDDLRLIDEYVKSASAGHTPPLTVRLSDIAERYQSIPDIIQAGNRKPGSRLHINWDYQLPANTLFPEFAKIRSLEHLLAFLAQHNADKGDIQASADCLNGGLLLSMCPGREGILIGHLVTNACLAIQCKALGRVAGHKDIPEPIARQLYNTLASLDIDTSYRSALQGERADFIVMYAYIRKNPQSMSGLPGLPGRALSLPMGIALYNDEEAYLRGMRKILASAGKPYRETHAELQKQVLAAATGSKLIARCILPVFAKLSAKRDTAKANIAGSQILLALNVYHQRYGQYPRSIEQLRERVGWKIPIDPFSGKDFVYRSVGKGCIFYSIGEDLHDDNGIERKAQTYKPVSHPGTAMSMSATSHDTANYDIVWTMK